MGRPNRLGLSSRTSTSEPIGVRLPSELADLVRTACANQGTTPSELLRSLVENWAYGDNARGLAGPDLGYQAAKSKAAQIAYKVLSDAIRALPADHEELEARLQEHQSNLADARRKS